VLGLDIVDDDQVGRTVKIRLREKSGPHHEMPGNRTITQSSGGLKCVASANRH